MHRRTLLKQISAFTLYSTFPAVLTDFFASCKTGNKKLREVFFNDKEFVLLEEVCNIILPRTSTPGAADIQLAWFIELTVKNCLPAEDQSKIKKGLQQLQHYNGASFSSLTAAEKINAIKETDHAAFKDDTGKAWFRIIKKLALIGYFTSQEGVTNALNYVKVPGNYQACIPYKKGNKAMAKTFLMYY
jgi:Gluconate 2-dehydrogenase subunit 3